VYKQAEGVKAQLLAGFNRLRTLWQRIHIGKFKLKYLIPLILAGFMLGLAFLLHSSENKLHRSHHSDYEHHDMKDKHHD
jgi:hypothetical protein